MKKMIAIIMAAMMILGMNLGVFAAEQTTKATTGTISIIDPLEGQTYDIYLMFELESYQGDAYLYTVTEEWSNFVTSDTVGKEFFELYDGNHVRLKTNTSDYTAADLAKAAVAYAEDPNNKIGRVAQLPTSVTDAGTVTLNYTANNLAKLGYYAINSSAGALCSLTTTDPIGQVDEKNSIPTIDKLVLEEIGNDTNGNPTGTWGDDNDAEIGDTVYYKTEISAMPGAHDYVLHDRMGVGLDFNKKSIAVTSGTGDVVNPLNGYLVGVEVNGTVNPAMANDAAYSAAGYQYYVLYDVPNEDATTEVCDFEVHFTEAFLATIKDPTTITVTYNAVLNESAKIHDERNVNATKLEYGDQSFTTLDFTYTHTYMFDLFKTDAVDNILPGAEFKMYRATTSSTENALKMKNENGTDAYLEPEPLDFISLGNGNYLLVEEGREAATKTISAGNVRVKGFDKGIYYLVETKAPEGYNKVDYAITVDFKENEGTGLSGNILGTVSAGKYTTGGVRVINNTGTLLPETGGTGRTILYTAGSILTVGAAVVIVTKKRMKNEE